MPHKREISLLCPIAKLRRRVSLLLGALAAINASAQITVATISATVGSISDPPGKAPSGIHVNDAALIHFSYGTASSVSTPNAQNSTYNFDSANFSFDVTVGGLTWNSSTAGSVTVTNNYSVPPANGYDAFTVKSEDINGAPATFPGAIQRSNFEFTITDSSFNLVSGVGLPRATADLTVGSSTVMITLRSASNAPDPMDYWQIILYPTFPSNLTLTTSAIPEPSAYAAIGGVLTLLGAGVVRWQRTRPAA